MPELRELELIARNTGAWIDDTHVVLPSGLHSTGFFSHASLVSSEACQAAFGSALANLLLAFEKEYRIKIGAIVGPLEEGGLWGGLIRNFLVKATPMREISVALTRREGTAHFFRFDKAFKQDDRLLVKDKPVAILNDVLSSSTNTGPTIAAVVAAGGFPKVIITLCDRRVPTSVKLPLEVLSLFQIDWPLWATNECPLCPDTPVNLGIGRGQEYPNLFRLMENAS